MKRGADSEERAFKEALKNGSVNRRTLSWSEPWDWERAKQGVRAASRAMPFRRFAVYGLAIPLAAVLAVRFGIEGAGEFLTWWRIVGLTAVCLGFYVLTVCSGVLSFADVTFGRKRVDILYGSDSSGRIPYDQVESFSFERWQGQSVFVVKGVDKFKKRPVTAKAILSTKLTESDVVDYLMARGLGHLYKGTKEVAEDPRSLNRVMEECGKPLSGRAIYGLACFWFFGMGLFPLFVFAIGPHWLRLMRVSWSHDALCLAALGLVFLEGGLYWLMMRAGGLRGLSREYFRNHPSVSLCTVLVLSVLLNPVWIAGVLAFWRIAVPIWALAVGQIAWLLGAYAVGRHWRQLPLEKRV